MKKEIKKILAKIGYRVNKIPKQEVHLKYDDAFNTQKELLSKFNEKLTIFDVGAYVGHIALKYNKLFPNSKIYCFEPFPESFSKLEQATSSYKNIAVINKGLSDQEGQSKFNANKSAPTNSLLKTYALGKKNWGEGLLDTLGSVDVELTTVDNFVEENNIKKIDVLKLDVQGAEFLVLNGAKQSFEKGIVKMIYTEMIIVPTYEGQIPFEETIKLIKSYGFKLFSLYNFSLSKEGQLRQLDAIFIKSDLY